MAGISVRGDGVAPAAPFTDEPVLRVSSRDGTTIAVFGVVGGVAGGTSTGPGIPSTEPEVRARPPLLLIHGASADHTTFRVVGPMLARSRAVFALDRRGRGASGDADDYAIEREYDDVAAVAEALAGIGDGPRGGGTDGAVDVVGHSYGGRCALGATLRTDAIRRVVAYEGAPVPEGVSYRPPGLLDELRRRLGAGEDAAALDAFLSQVVGMSPAALEAYHREPVWPARVAAAHTILREIDAEGSPAASLAELAAVRVPVLLILGSSSVAPFRIGTDALAAALPDAALAVIEGAAHAAHHTHAAAFVAVVERFLDA